MLTGRKAISPRPRAACVPTTTGCHPRQAVATWPGGRGGNRGPGQRSAGRRRHALPLPAPACRKPAPPPQRAQPGLQVPVVPQELRVQRLVGRRLQHPVVQDIKEGDVVVTCARSAGGVDEGLTLFALSVLAAMQARAVRHRRAAGSGAVAPAPTAADEVRSLGHPHHAQRICSSKHRRRPEGSAAAAPSRRDRQAVRARQARRLGPCNPLRPLPQAAPSSTGRPKASIRPKPSACTCAGLSTARPLCLPSRGIRGACCCCRIWQGGWDARARWAASAEMRGRGRRCAPAWPGLAWPPQHRAGEHCVGQHQRALSAPRCPLPATAPSARRRRAPPAARRPPPRARAPR